MGRPQAPTYMQTLIMGTKTDIRQKKLKEFEDAESARFSIKKSGSKGGPRYLVYIDRCWVGEMPTVAAKAMHEAETTGVNVALKKAKVMMMPANFADVRRAAFEMFDPDYESPRTVLGVAVMVEIGGEPPPALPPSNA